MIPIEPHAEGCILRVHAQPGARKNELRGQRDAALRVAVTQAPEKGKANKAIAALLAQELGLKRSQVELLSGDTAREKRFLIRGLAPEVLAARIAERSS